MDCYEARLESFRKARRVKTKTSTVVLKWPHPNTYLATPEQLAEAGFYFNPSAEARDGVKCFMCKKELDDWDEDDDPISIHFARCRDICAWAVARCGNMEDLDASGGFVFKDPSRAPTSKTMEKARHETFASGWPHDGIRGHGASSKRMAKAGFLYAPHSSGDDTAICVYCTTSLSGWDADDNPLEEHRKRVSKSGRRCAFFEMLEGPSKPTKPVRASKSAPHSKSRSKKKSADEEEDEDALSSDEISELTATTTTKSKRTTRASSVPAKTPASQKSTRSSGTTGHRKAAGASETEDNPDASGNEAGKRVSKSKKKVVVKAKERIEAIEEVDEDGRAEVVEEPVVQKPKRGRPPGKAKAKAKTAVAETLPDDAEVDSAPKMLTQTRTRSKPTLESDSEPAPLTKPPSSQPKSKTSAKSKNAEDNLSESEDSRKKATTRKGHDDAELMPPPKIRPKMKASTTSKAKAIEIESDEEDLSTSVPRNDEAQKFINKPPSNRLAEKPPSNIAQHDVSATQAKGRKSSSTSEDAGYATAEQLMDVDDGREDRQHAKNRDAPTFPDNLEVKRTSSTALSVSKTTSDVDVEMSDARAPTRGGKGDQLTDSTFTRSFPKPAPQEAVMPPLRVSSRTTGSLARPPSRIATEIVDISSDDDDELDVLKAITSLKPSSTSSAASAVKPPSSSSSSSLTGTRLQKAQKHPPPLVLPSTQSIPSSAVIDTQHTIVNVAKTSLARHTTPSAPLPDIDMNVPKDETTDTSRVKPSSMANLKDTRILSSTAERSPSPLNHLPDTSNVPPSEPAPLPATTLPSFDEDIAAESYANDPAVETFTPFLSMMAVHKLASLTEDEGNLTIEQYIRRELERQYQQFKEDGEQQIALFKQRAAETRKRIVDL